MNKTNNLLVFLSLIITSTGLTQLNDVVYRGNIKSVRFTQYNLAIKDSSTFDYDSTITPGWNFYTKFDRNGNKRIHNQYDYEENEELLNYYSFTHNANGLEIARTKFYASGNLYGEGESYYNKNNQLDSSIWRSEVNDVLYYYIYEKENNNLIREDQYWIKHNWLDRDTSISSKLYWNNEQNLVSKMYKIDEEKMIEGFEYAYAKNGLLSIKTELDSTYSLKYTHHYTYNESDLILEEKRYSKNGILDYKTTYVYNDRNDLIERTVYDKNENIQQQIISKFHYDADGNWVRKEEFWDGIPRYTTYRTLSYY